MRVFIYAASSAHCDMQYDCLARAVIVGSALSIVRFMV